MNWTNISITFHENVSVHIMSTAVINNNFHFLYLIWALKGECKYHKHNGKGVAYIRTKGMPSIDVQWYHNTMTSLYLILPTFTDVLYSYFLIWIMMIITSSLYQLAFFPQGKVDRLILSVTSGGGAWKKTGSFDKIET